MFLTKNDIFAYLNFRGNKHLNQYAAIILGQLSVFTI